MRILFLGAALAVVIAGCQSGASERVEIRPGSGDRAELELLRALRDSAAAGSSSAAVQVVMLEHLADPSDDAWIHRLKALAHDGNANAAYSVGNLYLVGTSVEHDEDSTLTYLRMAAEGGIAKADSMLAAFVAHE